MLWMESKTEAKDIVMHPLAVPAGIWAIGSGTESHHL